MSSLSFQRFLTSQDEYDVCCPERPQFGKYDINVSEWLTKSCP